MNILILGATGKMGTKIVTQLINENKHQIFLVTRNIKKLSHLEKHPNIKIYQGDSTNLLIYDTILKDNAIDTIISAVGANILHKNTYKICSTTTKTIIFACKEKNINPRLIIVSGAGTKDLLKYWGILARIGFKLIFSEIYHDKDLEKDLLEKSGFDYLLLQPTILTDQNTELIISDIFNHKFGLFQFPKVNRNKLAEFIARNLSTKFTTKNLVFWS